MIFSSDCDVINYHLNDYYNFDIIDNKYKYYLPNLMRHHGKVEKVKFHIGIIHLLIKCIKRQNREKGNTKNKIESVNTLI